MKPQAKTHQLASNYSNAKKTKQWSDWQPTSQKTSSKHQEASGPHPSPALVIENKKSPPKGQEAT